MSKMISLAMLLGLSIAAALVLAAAPHARRAPRGANVAMQQGNWKDAYEAFRALALEPAVAGDKGGQDLKLAINCLQNLGRNDETDDFRDAAIEAHKGDWRFLLAAGQTLADGEHYGFIVAGKFGRGGHRGGGRFVDSGARDRVRALQLLLKARDLAKDDADRPGVATLHLEFARILMFEAGGIDQGWRAPPPDRPEGAARLRGESGRPLRGQGPGYGLRRRRHGRAGRRPGRCRRQPRLLPPAQVVRGGQGRRRALAVDARAGRRARPLAAERGADDPGRTSSTSSSASRRWRWAASASAPAPTTARRTRAAPTPSTPSARTRRSPASPPASGDSSSPTSSTSSRSIARSTRPRRAPGARRPAAALAGIFEDRRQYPKAADVWQEDGRAVRPRRQRLPEAEDRPDRRQLGPVRHRGDDARRGRPQLEFRFRNGKKVHFEAPRSPGPQAPGRRQGLPQVARPPASSTGTR